MANHEFRFVGFLYRLAFSVALVFLTYNPSGHSWAGYLSADFSLVYKVAAGVILVIGWVMFLRATWRSLGPIGMALAAAFFGVIVWLFMEWGLFEPQDTLVLQWVALCVVAFVLAVGMSWSHVRRRLSGQFDTDEVEG